MNIFRSRFRSCVISVCLVLVAVLSCMIVPAVAAPTSQDGVIQGLLSGWSSSYAPTAYSNSWFWEMLSELRSLTSLSDALDSGWSNDLTTTPLSGSWFAAIRNNTHNTTFFLDEIFDEVTSIKLKVFTIQDDVTSLKDTVTTYLPGFSNQFTTIANSLVPLTSIQSDLERLDDNFSSFYLRFIQSAVKIDNIASDTVAIEGQLDILNGMANNLYLELQDIGGGMDKLVDVFASPEDLALRDKTKGSLVAAATDLPDVSRDMSLLMDVKDFVSFGEFEPPSFAELFDIESIFSDSWFSSDTASSLLVGSGSNSLLGISSYSRYVAPDTPLWDSNYSSVLEALTND